jgi:hypothetical protein
MDYKETDYQQGQAPSRENQGGKGSGPGALWLLLAPVACCGGPLIIGALAAAGALARGALGLGVALVVAVAVIVVAGRRRSRACCPPGPGPAARAAVGRFPAR